VWAVSASRALRYIQTADDRFYLAREALIKDLPPELFNPPTKQAVGSGSVTVEDSAGEAVAMTLKAAQVDEELKKDGTGTGQEEIIAEPASGTN